MFTFLQAADSQIDDVVSLVQRVYEASGYIKAGEENKIGSFLYRTDLATSVCAYYNKQLIGTVSVVFDSKQGLPMDAIYRSELQLIRDRQQPIAEVCQFAIDRSILIDVPLLVRKKAEAELALQLLALIIKYCQEQGLYYISFAINPKHRFFYETLGAELIGVEKKYDSVNDAPALGYLFSLDRDLDNNLPFFLRRARSQIEPLFKDVFR